MFLNTYSEGIAACLSGERKIDGAYIFYTAGEPASISPELDATAVESLHCDATKGVLRTKGVVCSNVTLSDISFTLTSKGGEELSARSPGFGAGVNIYNIVLVTTGVDKSKDILLLSTELTNTKVPAGADIAFTVTLALGAGEGVN